VRKENPDLFSPQRKSLVPILCCKGTQFFFNPPYSSICRLRCGCKKNPVLFRPACFPCPRCVGSSTCAKRTLFFSTPPCHYKCNMLAPIHVRKEPCSFPPRPSTITLKYTFAPVRVRKEPCSFPPRPSTMLNIDSSTCAKRTLSCSAPPCHCSRKNFTMHEF
jgi:hypothetical protein